MKKAQSPKFMKSLIKSLTVKEKAKWLYNMDPEALRTHFNMYRQAINVPRPPVCARTITRYVSGYDKFPLGTDPTFAAFILAVR